MTSNWHTGDSVYSSQNFRLRFSGGSTSDDSSLQRFVTAKNTEDERDVIVISDSSCSSSPERIGKSKWKSISTPDVKNKEYQIHFVETSSESERESDSSWDWARPDNKFPKKIYTNKTVIQANKVPTEASLISKGASLIADRLFDALLASDTLTNNTAKIAVGSNANCDRNKVNESKRFIDKSKRHVNTSPTLITEQIHSKQKEKYTEEMNKVIKPNYATYNYSPNVPSRHLTYNTPKQDSTGKIRLTKKDTYKILKNIKDTQVYDSPRMEKETNVIIDESTDIDEDVVHPAVSRSYNKKAQRPSDSPDIIDSSLKNDILQTDLSEPSMPRIDISRVMDSFRPLSERRKKQIKEWLLTNFDSDSQNNSSFNTVPPSTRNGSSGNSSLERLEKAYETPNNRGRINKVQTDERQAYETPNNRGRINNVQTDEKQRTIVNSDRVAHSVLIRQTTLDQYFKKIKNNSEFCTPDNKPWRLPKAQTDKKASSVANTFGTKGIMDCADILDKLYGTSWRDKANALVSTEPQKISNQPINRIVQTERKPVSKNQYHADTDQYLADWDSDKSDLAENKIKSNRGRNIQRKRKEMDSFINDESSSSSDNEAYYTALTNPTSRVTSSRTKSVPESIKRLQKLCDTDTENENDKSSNPKDLHRRKLSFSDDESSSTSEFDPEDYVPPKYTPNKEVTKKPISKVASKFESTVTKSVRYETFLVSLSNTIPMNRVHPDTQKYRLDYKNNKEELCKKLYDLYNEKIFGNKLPQNMTMQWNVRMRGTAGYCYNKETVTNFRRVKSSRIELATKILDTPDRLRDTLMHEMCHAAVWLIDGVNDGHGPLWTKWAKRAMKTFPELPPVRRCHNYEIKTKFTYKCTSCGYSIGRHSKSLDIEKKRCGYCYGKFQLLINKTTKSGTVQVQTLKREPTGFALYVKQNYNLMKKEKSNMRHADVMKLLGQQFSAVKISKNTDVVSN